MLECKRRFDRISTCYLSDDILRLDPIFENEEHCMVEVLDVSECCAAKQAGKQGSGLDLACGSSTIIQNPKAITQSLPVSSDSEV